MQPITKKLPFGDLYLHQNYIIAVMHQGVTIKPEHNKLLEELANNHFKNRSFAYITHRKNSYAVDPSVYYETAKIENLCALAVVSQKEIDSKTVPVEKMFYSKPFQLFDTLEAAVAWALEQIKKQA